MDGGDGDECFWVGVLKMFLGMCVCVFVLFYLVVEVVLGKATVGIEKAWKREGRKARARRRMRSGGCDGCCMVIFGLVCW